MKFKISESASVALDILHKNGYEAYIVGGSVRDMYLGKDAHDFDITTNAVPHITKNLFCDFTVVETGMKHGTVTAVISGENIEITTYRQEGEYSDSRHPDKVEFTTSLPLDLSRRDFTVNALAYDGSEELIDLFGGKEDIENKVIKAIGNPYDRFSEDALRILRGIRFASVLDFEIEEKTKRAMLDLKHLLHKISRERIAEEINKFLCGKSVKRVLLDMWEVLAEIIPEIPPIKNPNATSIKTPKNEVKLPAIKPKIKKDKTLDKRPISPPFAKPLPSFTDKKQPKKTARSFIN